MQRKIILLDWGYFIFSSITFKSRMLQTKNKLEKEGKYEKAKKIFIMPSPYTTLMKLFSNLKKIGVDADNDIVILAVDGRRSWRKEQEKEYKGNRKSLREKVPFINWDKEFELQNELLDKINISLPFFIIKIEHLEADDIIATAVKYFKDDLCTIVATDCLNGNTKVKLAQGGSKYINKIKQGDKVLSFNFKTKTFEIGNVVNTHKVIHNIEYNIYYNNYKNPIKSSENHYFLTNKGWKKAKELKKGDYLYHRQELLFPTNNIQTLYKIGYILGLAEGDGWIDYKHNLIKFEMKDKEPIERVINYVNSMFKTNYKIKRNKRIKKSGFDGHFFEGEYYHIELYLNVGFEFLMKYKNSKSKDFKRGFLAGFFDAEGSIIELKSILSIKFYNTNKKLLNIIKTYLKDISLNSSKIFESTKEKCLEFCLDSDNTVRFFNYCKPALLRKYPSWKFYNSYLQNGFKINKIIKKKSKRKGFKHYDLTVLPYHNYIINDKIVVHNSDYNQLLIYDNVRIFVPLAKRKGSPYIPYRILNLDREKEKKLAFKSLSKKINKETPDNLNDELLTEKDFDTRLNVISLLDLPDFVTMQVKEKLDIINEFSDKPFNLECLPYKNMRKNYFEIFKPDKIVSYDLCRKRLEKKLNKQKSKKGGRK